MSLPEFIRTRRTQLGLTQADILAGLLEHGGKQYTDAVVTHWEHGRAAPPIHDPQFVRALAAVLRVSQRDILTAAGFNLGGLASVVR